MPIDAELEDILLRWEEEQEFAKPSSIEELCRNVPERIEEVRVLIQILRNVDARISEPPDGPAHGPGNQALPPDIATLARFRVVRWHARGGLGEVFVAYDEELHREVALKLIQYPYSAERRQRFLREAEITARLGHPGIVPIFAVGQTKDGQPCYAMRFIEGETLRAAINTFHSHEPAAGDPRERTLRFRNLISRLIAVCQAIGFAHSRGVIHRDLKPDNIMLGQYHETLVVDWGLAKLYHETDEYHDELHSNSSHVIEVDSGSKDSLTRMGTTLGTPAYMSPEQASGKSSEVGPSSDIYSLGATLYVLLTGRAAFEPKPKSSLIDCVRRGDFPPPLQAKPSISPALAAVCLKAMALRPADRYTTVLDLANELERWLADEPVAAYHEPPGVRFGRWVRRHRPLVAGAAALAATAIVALLVSSLLLGREQTKTKLALDDSRANYRLAQTTLADVQTQFGLTATDRHSPLEGALWFAESSETANFDFERSYAGTIRARTWARGGPEPVGVLEFHESPPHENLLANGIRQIAFDGPDAYLIAISTSGLCVLHDVQKDQAVALPGEPRNVTVAAWGAVDRSLLALGKTDGSVDLIQLPSAKLAGKLGMRGAVACLEFSHDGKLLAMGSNRARVADLAKKTFVTRDLEHDTPLRHLVLNDQADRLATVDSRGKVRVFEVPSVSSKPLFEVTPVNPNFIRPNFIAGGKKLLLANRQEEMAEFDATTGSEIRRYDTGMQSVTNVLSDPNKSAIVLYGATGGQFIDTKTGKLLSKFGDESIETAAFTPKGNWLLTSVGSYQTGCIAFPSGERQGWRLPHSDVATHMVVSANNRHFALAQRDGLVRIFKFLDFLPGDRLSPTKNVSPRIALSRDGRLVLPLGRDLYFSPKVTQVHDIDAGQIGPDLHAAGILHGGAISPDGQTVATLSSPSNPPENAKNDWYYSVGTNTGWIEFWDWKNAKPRFPAIATPSEPIGATYSPDGTKLVVICTQGECLWISSSNGKIIRTTPNRGFKYKPGWDADELLRFSPDGTLVALWGIGPLCLIDPDTGAAHSPPLPAEFEGTYDARFSPDGQYLAIAGNDKRVRIWDIKSGRLAAPPLDHPDWIFQVKFSSDGLLLLTACRDKLARVWNWRTGTLIGPPAVHAIEVKQVSFLNHDQWFLTQASSGVINVWEVRTGKPLVPSRHIGNSWGNQLCVSEDGMRAVVCCAMQGGVRVFDLSRWFDLEDPRYASDRIRTTAEVISGQKIVMGSGMVTLTTKEWLDRWREYKNANSRAASSSN